MSPRRREMVGIDEYNQYISPEATNSTDPPAS